MQGKRIFKIAPGEGAIFWPECEAGNYICVGWDDVGDLRQFNSKQDFQKVFFAKYPASKKGDPTPTIKSKELWTLMDLRPGDLVIANQGIKKVLAIGEVVEPGYKWRDDRQEYKHTVCVKWDTSRNCDIDPQKRWGLVTIAPVPVDLYNTIIAKNREEPTPPIAIEPEFFDIADALDHKGQVILYGPPGTGKTFAARRFAVWWLLQKMKDLKGSAILSDETAFRKAEEELKSNGRLTFLTFHGSYSYEDFIEGFRPVVSVTQTLVLRLEDGVFKSVCQKAGSRRDEPFLVVIDEINRANIAKVFGEIVTLLEKDKRGLEVTLPQSKQGFVVPENVFILGTMNTADRSIKLLDAALRRRFAFVEFMSDASLLRGAELDGLNLEAFLDELNRRIVESADREKQIGHSFLLHRGEPISDPKEFCRRFRQEILPLLQEYCYEDYSTLAKYLGEKLVNLKEQALDMELLRDATRLPGILAEEFQKQV
jgi:5-methylcytosine-specific restriction enzyme B